MVQLGGRFGGIRCVDVWWPGGPEEVEPLLVSAPVVLVRQCTRATGDSLQRSAFRRRTSPTLLVDLTRPVDALWSDLHAKSCRAKVRKAEALDCRVLVGQDAGDAIGLVAAHISRLGYMRPPSEERWRELQEAGEVFAVAHEDRLLAAHLFLADERRARMLYSGTAPRSDRDVDRLAGWANRYLHWWEILHYRERGLRVYDLGGIDMNPSSPLYSITEFKRSFGGSVVPEESVYVAGNAVLRRGLRAASRTRLVVRRALN